MKVKYVGEGDREFPTLALTVTPGQVFDAPKDFAAADVVLAGKDEVSAPVEQVATDPTPDSGPTVGA